MIPQLVRGAGALQEYLSGRLLQASWLREVFLWLAPRKPAAKRGLVKGFGAQGAGERGCWNVGVPTVQRMPLNSGGH
jgi:hypothetical protein